MELGAQDFYYYDEGALNSLKKGAKFVYIEAPKKAASHGYKVVVGGGKLSRKGHLKQALKYGAIATAADTITSKAVDKAVDKMLGESVYETVFPGIFITENGYYIDESGNIYNQEGTLLESDTIVSDAGNFVKKVGKGFIKANIKAQRNFDNTAIGGYCKAFRTNIKKKLK